MKFLVPKYSCLQNPWLRGYCTRSPLSLSSVLNRICCPPPKKNSWLCHWSEWKSISPVHWDVKSMLIVCLQLVSYALFICFCFTIKNSRTALLRWHPVSFEVKYAVKRTRKLESAEWDCAPWQHMPTVLWAWSYAWKQNDCHSSFAILTMCNAAAWLLFMLQVLHGVTREVEW
jgi:hypothetical protein